MASVFVFIASPLMMAGGAVWVVLRDEYQRILQARIRKW
jgi:Na+-transporting NADH:ubiquinone oxidoreductase subunit NqrB